MERIVGIIGGMGPAATVDMIQKIIDNTPAVKDQDHLHLIVDSNPKVPDRLEALINRGEDPTPYLLESAIRLENAGADFLVIACNTAHCFLPQIADRLRVPVINMQDTVAKHVVSLMVNKVGLMATSGMIQSGLYQDAFDRYGLQCIIPDAKNQESITSAIYCIKAGRKDHTVKNALIATAKYLIESQGCQAILAGCTELPIVLGENDLTVPLIDPATIIARTVVKECIGVSIG